jgi:hypothetical protein
MVRNKNRTSLDSPIEQPGVNIGVRLWDRPSSKMERFGIAAIFCMVIYTGRLPDLLESFLSDKTEWVIVSGMSHQRLSGPCDSERPFQGMRGLDKIAEFCRDNLKIVSSDMTGCIIKSDDLFAFGKLNVQYDIEKSPAETSFVAKLAWRGLQIISAEFRIMWPFQ